MRNIYCLKLPETETTTIAGLRSEIDMLKRCIEELVSHGGDAQYRVVNAYMPTLRKFYKRDRVEQDSELPPRPPRLDSRVGLPENDEDIPKIADHRMKLRRVA